LRTSIASSNGDAEFERISSRIAASVEGLKRKINAGSQANQIFSMDITVGFAGGIAAEIIAARTQQDRN